MKSIVLITSRFPYGSGESFIENELKEISLKRDISYSIMPMSTEGLKRDIREDITVDPFLAEKIKKTGKLKKIRLSIFSKNIRLLLYEFSKNGIFNIKKNLEAIRSFLNINLYFYIFRSYIRKHRDKSFLFYTYWNVEMTYALQLLKKKCDLRLISRIHGIDLYKERKKYDYMPFKNQFNRGIDLWCPISEHGKYYLINEYDVSPDSIEVHRLGVMDNHIICEPNGGDKIILVSCSSLLKVKRIDRIIKGILAFIRQNPSLTLEWTHIGGKRNNKYSKIAKEIFKDHPQISFDFKGSISNKDIFDFYEKNNIDVFINTSESEGVPVSIMEAMSCHIPVIATDVGGVSELVEDKKNGILLSGDCRISEIVDALSQIDFFRDKSTREEAYNMFKKRYDSQENFNRFNLRLIELIEED